MDGLGDPYVFPFLFSLIFLLVELDNKFINKCIFKIRVGGTFDLIVFVNLVGYLFQH